VTQLTSIKGTQLQIRIDNGLTGTNQAYAHPCMINAARGVQWTSSGQDENIPDCADPDALAWTTHTKATLSGSISGAGMLDATNVSTFWSWMNSDTAKTVKVDLNGTVGGVWTGSWKLTDFAVTGDRGKRAEVSVTMKSDGAQTYGTS
jgi:hypothetical protein